MIVFFQLDSNLTIWESESWKKAQVFDHRCARFNLTENSCIFFEHRRIEYDLWTEIIKSTWIQTCFTLCLIYLFIGIPVIYCNKVSQSNLKEYHTIYIIYILLFIIYLCHLSCPKNDQSIIIWTGHVTQIIYSYYGRRKRKNPF